MPNIFSQDLKPVVEQKVKFYDFAVTAKKSRYKKLSELSIVRSFSEQEWEAGWSQLVYHPPLHIYPVFTRLEARPSHLGFLSLGHSVTF
jgi:hypothetical protein